jgi:glycosyltransferase involved in cell wall biosynthesis
VADDPLVTILTPSLNSGKYIRQSIDSVLAQDYPHIEHIVVDGGSTDGTCEILAEYSDVLAYESLPDGGAAEAINKGFQRSNGRILGWLNADDVYLPGAIRSAVRQLREWPDVDVVYGEAFWIDADGARIGEYPTRPFKSDALARECFICQPASFVRRAAFERVGMLDPEERIAFDYDLWIRLQPESLFRHVPESWACSRMHRASLSFADRKAVLQANMRLLGRHFGYIPLPWIYALCCYIVDGRDQFFEPSRHALVSYGISLPFGLCQNRRHPARFLGEWLSTPVKAAARALGPAHARRNGAR